LALRRKPIRAWGTLSGVSVVLTVAVTLFCLLFCLLDQSARPAGSRT